MIRYLDTSAALKLVIAEPESVALADELNRSVDRGDDLVASMLLFTELHCAAQRRHQLSISAVNAVVDRLTLFNLTRADLLRAATSAWGLRSADAIHLAAALRIQADDLITYDRELTATAAQAGLRTSRPGA